MPQGLRVRSSRCLGANSALIQYWPAPPLQEAFELARGSLLVHGLSNDDLLQLEVRGRDLPVNLRRSHQERLGLEGAIWASGVQGSAVPATIPRCTT